MAWNKTLEYVMTIWLPFCLIMDSIKVVLTKRCFGRELDPIMLVLQIYVDDIVFGCSNDFLGNKFSDLMSTEFELSLLSN